MIRWQQRAACAGLPTSWFFIEAPGAAGQRDARRAKAICAGCPVQTECLLANLDTTHGIFGGATDRQRADFLRRAA